MLKLLTLALQILLASALVQWQFHVIKSFKVQPFLNREKENMDPHLTHKSAGQIWSIFLTFWLKSNTCPFS